jgi:glycine cleavage system H protein
MPDSPPPLIFPMGKFAAEFPTDRQYAKNHMWGQRREDCLRFGFTAYAVRLLQDVYFLDWSIEPGMDLAERQEIGSIESKKAESSLYAPIAGRVASLNEDLLSDPSAINLDKYGSGWLFEIAGSGDNLLSPEKYLEHLAGVWEIAQRTIKGQMNE